MAKIKRKTKKSPKTKSSPSFLRHYHAIFVILTLVVIASILVLSYNSKNTLTSDQEFPTNQVIESDSDADQRIKNVLLTLTPIPYENWNTYTSERLKYTIDYEGNPSAIIKDNLEGTLHSRLVELVTLPYDNYNIIVAVWKNYDISITDLASFKEWCKKSSEDYLPSNPYYNGTYYNDDFSCMLHRNNYNTPELTTVSGKTAYVLGDWIDKAIFVPDGDYVYELTVDITGNSTLGVTDRRIDYAFSTFKLD